MHIEPSPGPMYFGTPWPSGICDSGRHVPTPIGMACAFCEELIDEDDHGTFIGDGTTGMMRPVHRECSLRMVLGGIGHHEDHAFWCTTVGDPDGGRTPRQSAQEVWERREEFMR